MLTVIPLHIVSPLSGEVKLLDWLQIPTLVRPGDSVALVGGDSDLVLEALALSPKITHNTFVILPDKKRRSYCVSLWETTRRLTEMFPEITRREDVINMRTDLVLLLILNGNDYFPKMRGGNFDRFFDAYAETVRRHAGYGRKCFLIDPRTLEFNLDFGVDFFEELKRTVNQSLFADDGGNGRGNDNESIGQYLGDNWREGEDIIVEEEGGEEEGGIIDAEEDVDENVDDNDEDVEDDETIHSPEEDTDHEGQDWDPRVNGKNMFYKDIFSSPLNALHMLIAQNILPRPYPPKISFFRKGRFRWIASIIVGGDSGTLPVKFEIEWEEKSKQPWLVMSKKRIRQILAELVLDSLIPDWQNMYEDLNYSSHQDMKAAQHDTEEYVKGIIWNLETYKKGVCVDYSYNYGRRRR